MDLISVVIPAYNAEQTIKKCLKSISEQTYKEIEIIVVNDGSTDDTETIIREYISEEDRIRLYTQDNKGVSAARNNGIAHANGKYIAFVDSDDYIEPDMYEVMEQAFRDSVDTDVVICNYYEDKGQECKPVLTNSKQELSCTEAMVNLFIESSYCAYLCTKLFRAEIIKNHKILCCEEIDVCEDCVFCTEYFSKIRKAKYINRELYHYRILGESASHKKYNKKRYTALKACDKVTEIVRIIDDQKLQRAVNAFCSVICVQLVVMTGRNKSEDNRRIYKFILGRFKERKWNFLLSEWGIKYKVVFTVLKVIGYFVKS